MKDDIRFWPPAARSNLRAEWWRWEISAELDPCRKLSDIRAVRLGADEVHERSFSFTDPGQAVLLGSFLAGQLRADE